MDTNSRLLLIRAIQISRGTISTEEVEKSVDIVLRPPAAAVGAWRAQNVGNTRSRQPVDGLNPESSTKRYSFCG
ncbi:hypothetical protein [Paraburkholderia rhizosphaerae]|uniref:hypothetical protein n=1 Tax=Paraburkholderia rhizosphaerae TaxID=480658 RepID=UPI0010665EB6|nr:hypothetical protein [Paraburkholderia rhizosphaerae]